MLLKLLLINLKTFFTKKTNPHVARTQVLPLFVLLLFSGSVTGSAVCCSPDAGGEEGVAGRGEAARPCCQPIRAAERQERTTMGHQGLTCR